MHSKRYAPMAELPSINQWPTVQQATDIIELTILKMMMMRKLMSTSFRQESWNIDYLKRYEYSGRPNVDVIIQHVRTVQDITAQLTSRLTARITAHISSHHSSQLCSHHILAHNSALLSSQLSSQLSSAHITAQLTAHITSHCAWCLRWAT